MTTHFQYELTHSFLTGLMVVICLAAWTGYLSGAKDRTDGKKYGPEYMDSARGENCPPRYDKDMEEVLFYG